MPNPATQFPANPNPAMPNQFQQPTQYQPTPQTPVENAIEQQWNSWASANGVDLSQFDGNVGAFLDAMREAAQAGFEAQDKQQPVPQQVAPTAEVNWRDWEPYLETNERGELVPKRDAPYQVPYAAVQQANDVLKKVQAFRYDPEGFLKQNVESLVAERAAAIADEKIKAFQQEQSRERDLDAFIGRNGEWLFNNGDQKQGMTEAGKKFLTSVQRSEELGVPAEHVLNDAWERFQGGFLKDALEQARNAQVTQQAQPQFDPSQQAAPQMGASQFAPQQDGQLRNPDSTFAPAPQQHGAPQAAPQLSIQDQIAQYGQPGQNGQLPFNGTQQPGQVQYQPTPNGHAAWNGTENYSRPVTQNYQINGQQQAPPFTQNGTEQPQQQTFLEQHNIPAAALEPMQRSSTDAGGAIGTPAFDQHVPDIEDITEESIRAAGLT